VIQLVREEYEVADATRTGIHKLSGPVTVPLQLTRADLHGRIGGLGNRTSDAHPMFTLLVREVTFTLGCVPLCVAVIDIRAFRRLPSFMLVILLITGTMSVWFATGRQREQLTLGSIATMLQFA
jgi:hypothetical protein